MPAKILEKEAQQYLFEKHENKYLMYNYIAMDNKCNFHCNQCGSEWITVPYNVIRIGTGCPKCGKIKQGNKKRLSYEYVFNFIEENKCHLLSKEYIKSSYKIEIEFECGHIGFTTFNDFQSGIRCGVCKYKNAGKYHAYTKEGLEKFFEKTEFTLLRILDGCKKVEFKCEYGHVNLIMTKHFMKSKVCYDCAAIKRGLEHRGENSSNWKGGISEINRYAREFLNQWKRQSCKKYNFKCAISNEIFDEIHHLYPFNLIMDNIFSKINIDFKKQILDYTKEELKLIEDAVIEYHNEESNFGVPLKGSIHSQFHKIYGNNCTPKDFYDFQEKIKLGIIIPAI
jgi:hypothetical protein